MVNMPQQKSISKQLCLKLGSAEIYLFMCVCFKGILLSFVFLVSQETGASSDNL